MQHRTADELTAALPEIQQSPATAGSVELIVRRPAEDEREVLEEVGIAVENVRYFASQPWPFPHSLMIAFTADWKSGEIRVDPLEIESAQWFNIRELPPLPQPISISRRLIDAVVADMIARLT